MSRREVLFPEAKWGCFGVRETQIELNRLFGGLRTAFPQVVNEGKRALDAELQSVPALSGPNVPSSSALLTLRNIMDKKIAGGLPRHLEVAQWATNNLIACADGEYKRGAG